MFEVLEQRSHGQPFRTDGTVRPCAIMNHTMGCVESEKGFKPVWNSDKYVELRSSHVPAMNKEPCETCKKCAYVERGIKKEEVLGYFIGLKEGPKKA